MADENKQHVLVVDDEPDIRELLEITLSRMGLETSSAADIQQAKLLLSSNIYQLCLTDMKLPDGNGIELVQHIQKNYPQLPVAMITAHGNMETAIEALKSGAFDFVSKPVDLNSLRNLVQSALTLTQQSEHSIGTEQLLLLGDSKAMQKTRKTISKLARSQAPVYISGESGVGKELVAKMIHYKGPRKASAFIPVNCGAIPAELMESEFFGHKKGSFTGATSDKKGLFQAANGGTLFLDEVADLPLHMQVKLLRAIQEKAVRPVGANAEITVDVRILSATHKDLQQLVQDGLFRQDLFYRINVIELDVPPLRKRTEDISTLAEYFLEQIATEWEIDKPSLADSALNALQNYSFPGNVRELENILERAMTLCEEDVISDIDLHLPEHKNNSEPSENYEPDSEILSLDPALFNKEKEVIMKALEKTKYNKTAAAKLLGISFRALRYRIKKLEIE